MREMPQGKIFQGFRAPLRDSKLLIFFPVNVNVNDSQVMADNTVKGLAAYES